MAAALLAAGAASAASQGGLSAISSATAQIGVVIPPRLHLSSGLNPSVNLPADGGRHAFCLSGRGVSAYAISVGLGRPSQLSASGEKGLVGYSGAVHTDRTGTVPLSADGESQLIDLRDRGGCEPMLLSLTISDGHAAPTDPRGGVLTVVVAPE